MDGRDVKKPYSDRRWHDNPGAVLLICSLCEHKGQYIPETGTILCDAFPEGIPDDLLNIPVLDKNLEEICNNGIRFKAKFDDGQNLYEEYVKKLKISDIRR